MRSIYAAHSWWLSLAIALAFAVHVFAAAGQGGLEPSAGPRCLDAVLEAHYPPLNSRPIAQVIRAKDGSTASIGAACFDRNDSPAIWVTVAAVNRTAASPDTFIGKFGAISQLLTVQYWSTTDQKWRPLVSKASAIDGPKLDQPRADYSAAELATGEDRYYLITDSRTGRASPYRLRLREVKPGRVVVETSNVAAIKEWGVTLYAANGLDTWYFLNERSPGVWAYYSITRVIPATFLAEGHEKSYINRAVALYRHYMGLPTDSEPPSAR
jgi:hypothetical protein